MGNWRRSQPHNQAVFDFTTPPNRLLLLERSLVRWGFRDRNPKGRASGTSNGQRPDGRSLGSARKPFGARDQSKTRAVGKWRRNPSVSVADPFFGLGGGVLSTKWLRGAFPR
jgi:hypothetical protein